MKKFDPNKQIQTRDGKPARLIAMNANHPRYPIIALITVDGAEIPASFTVHGHIGSDTDENRWDLINVPQKGVLKGWINVYPDGCSLVYRSKEEASKCALRTCLACVEISREYIEGEGL